MTATFCDRCACNGFALPAGSVAHSMDAAIAVNIRDRDSDGRFGPEGVSCFVSRLLLGHGFGAIPAPCGSSLFCFGNTALRVTVADSWMLASAGLIL
jgi:hypothetical protein